MTIESIGKCRNAQRLYQYRKALKNMVNTGNKAKTGKENKND
jgi:hypothetical protein